MYPLNHTGGIVIPDHLEIERRFLVDAREEKPWRTSATVIHHIEQHYQVGDRLTLTGHELMVDGRIMVTLSDDELKTMASTTDWVSRLRKRDVQWFLTYKSRVSTNSAKELEWEVTPTLASALLDVGPYPSIVKTRYVLPAEHGLVWEVDEFEGPLAGLVLAEIELVSGSETIALPSWIGQEITGLPSWSNHALSQTLTPPTV